MGNRRRGLSPFSRFPVVIIQSSGGVRHGPEHAKIVFHTPGFQTQNALHGDQNVPAINSYWKGRITRPGYAPTSVRELLISGTPRARSKRSIHLPGLPFGSSTLGQRQEIRFLLRRRHKVSSALSLHPYSVSAAISAGRSQLACGYQSLLWIHCHQGYAHSFRV